MKKKCCLFFPLLLLTLVGKGQVTQFPQVYYSTQGASGQNIRTTPSLTGNSVISVMTSKIGAESITNTTLNPYGVQNWIKVCLPNTTGSITYGYMLCNEFYARINEINNYATVITTTLNIRIGPGTANPNVTINGVNATFGNNSIVALTGNSSAGWYEVYLPNNCSRATGWLSGTFLSINSNTSNYRNVGGRVCNDASNCAFLGNLGGALVSFGSYGSTFSSGEGGGNAGGYYEYKLPVNVSATITCTHLNYNTSAPASYSYTASGHNYTKNFILSNTTPCTNSTAPTSALASPSSIPSGGSSTLTVNGGLLGSCASWKWYSGTCGGTFVGTGSGSNGSITVSPTSTTAYFVRAEGGNTTTCASVQVIVTTTCTNSTAPASATASPPNIPAGNSSALTVVGGSLGTCASWKWYTGSCGGTFIGTGSGSNGSITVSPTITTTYFVRAEGGNTTTCASVTVNVSASCTNSTAPSGAIASPASIPGGGSSTLTVSGGSLGSCASWKWYTGSCGGTFIGTGSGSNGSITVSPTATTAYFVRAEGGNTTSCASVTVTITSGSTITINATNTIIPPWHREKEPVGFGGQVTVNTSPSGSLWHLEVYRDNTLYYKYASTTFPIQVFSSLDATVPLAPWGSFLVNGNTITYRAVLDANNTTVQAGTTNVIEKRIDKSTIVFNNPSGDIKIPLKYIANTTGTRISFSRRPNTSTNNNNDNAGDDILSAISSTQLGSNRYFSLNIFSPGSNLANVRPGEFNYTIEYLGTSEIETGIFSLTKIGIIVSSGNNKVLIMVNGYENQAEENAKTIRNSPSGTNWDSSVISFSILRYLAGFNLDAWYVGQPNTNSVKRNAYDVAKAIEKIISLNPSANEFFLICHSKGGLDTRALLGSTNSNSNTLNKSLNNESFIFDGSSLDGKIKKVVFLATPHKGAYLAGWGNSNIPAIVDLRFNSEILNVLLTTNMPTNALFANLTGIAPTSWDGDGIVKKSSSEFPFLGNNRTAVQMYQFDYNGSSNGEYWDFHRRLHMTKNLSNYLSWTCNEILTNKQKVKRFLLNDFLQACDISTFGNSVSFQVTGSILSGSKVYLTPYADSTKYFIGLTDENGYINIPILNSNYYQNKIDIVSPGYDHITSTLDSNFVNSKKFKIALFRGNNTNMVQYPKLSLIGQSPIISNSTIQIKVTAQNATKFLVNLQNSDSIFVTLQLINNIATIPLDTGYNRVIVKFVGIDTTYQEKTIYYLPDTLMNKFAMNCAIQSTQKFIGSKLFVDNQFYCDIDNNNKTVKLLKGVNELKFSKFGYKDTLFIIDSATTINLSMQQYSYSSNTDSTIVNFNNGSNPQYWKNISIKNVSLSNSKQISAKQTDDNYSGTGLLPQSRKFVFRNLNSNSMSNYRTAIVLDQANIPDKDSIYFLIRKGNAWKKVQANQPGITEYDPEVQKVAYDSLSFAVGDTTQELVLMKKQKPVFKSLSTTFMSGELKTFPLKDFVADPDSIKNDMVVAMIPNPFNPDILAFIQNGNIVISSSRGFTGDFPITLSASHDFLADRKTFTIKIVPPDIPVNRPRVFPNPANTYINIEYILENERKADITIYNMLGQPVWSIKRTYGNDGYYVINVPVNNLPAGVYLVRMNGQNYAARFVKQ